MPSRPLQFPDAVPTELWENILSELSVQDLMQSMLVCRKFAQIILYLRLRYDSKLHDIALVDGVDSDVPLAARLDKIRCYQRAWEELSIQTEGGKEVVRSLSSHIHNAPIPQFLTSGWLCMPDAEGGLLFVRTPAISSPKEPRPHNGWYFAHRLPASVLPEYTRFRFDPSQDLIIFLNENDDGRCLEINVRSMTTGLQHPLAETLTLGSGNSLEPITDLNSFRIYEDFCAILAPKDSFEDRVLQVWDWRTGRRLLVQTDIHPWGDVIAFLGDRTLLVAHDECLQLHVFDEDDKVHSIMLELPRFQQDALQIWTTVSQPYAQAEPGRAFACDPASEVLVINMVRSDPSETKHSILIIVRVASLLEHAETAMYAPPDALQVPWADWGPRCTRFLRVPATCSWEAPTTFGRRVLIPYYLRGAPHLGLLDFDVDTEHVGSPPYETDPAWSVKMLKAPALEDFSPWLEEDCKVVRSDVPCRVRSRRLHNLPARLVGASLFENGFMLKVANAQQCDYVTMPLDI